MKDGAIYLLSRRVSGDHDEPYTQNISVFASSASEAKQIVNDQFRLLRQSDRAQNRAYQALPEFAVEKVLLDEYKMITAGVTQ
jgi:hypothetical protein